ncbi:hypothetical protein ES703_68968 [subsurface metagenome]
MLDQENPTDAEIAESIYTGVDCCRDALYPYKPIHITPSTAAIKPGESIYLIGKNITRECDPACYHWRIIRGGGSLRDEFGHATVFYAPFSVEECEGSAEVALFCSGWVVDTCRIGVNEYTGKEIAFFKIGNWKDGYLWDHTNKRTTTTLVGPRYKDLNPKRSTISISLHLCDGQTRTIYHDGLMQGSLATNEHYILQQRWFGAGIIEDHFWSMFGELANSFGAAKTRLLRNFQSLLLRIGFPTKKPWSDEWKAFHAYYRTCTFTPGTVLDIRTPPMREAKCCPPELI